MRHRSTALCIPALTILIMSWGTCPCLYAEILSGGLIRGPLEASPARACTCCCASREARCASRELGTSDEADTSAKGVPHERRCPCDMSGGTMRPLPEVGSYDLCVMEITATAPFALPLPRPCETPRDLERPSGTDPGPRLRSVVRLI